VAGLTFALSLPFPARIMLVTKGALGESNTRYAQGGLAAAVGEMDDPELHLEDTIIAGAGLVDVDAARALVSAGKASVEWLVDHGARFDQEDGRVALGKEAAHSRSRVLHAGGDATGAEIERALVSQIASRHDLTVLEHTAVVELRIVNGRCAGAELVSTEDGGRTTVTSAITVLALGGAGQLWAVTSNPTGATGDGIAIALRAGVAVADLEFTQFHPTVLDLPGHEPFLISEAVRGDGAVLRNDDGARFMQDVDPRAELAPRDVVARAIQAQITAGSRVWLDLRHLDASFIRQRFPTIDRHLRDVGIDMTTDLIPVAPAAHYFMGGIAASPEGRTSLAGLLAIGEVSCTGVHGANRLASNSLLEGLVFGRLAAQSLSPADLVIPEELDTTGSLPPVVVEPDPAARRARQQVQEIMRDDASVVRSATSLTRAIAALDALGKDPVLDASSLDAITARNMVQLAREIAISALARGESRGGHYRADYPDTNPALEGRHQLVTRSGSGARIREFGPLETAWHTAGATLRGR
jgi:L-aspartate oxidase